MNSATKPYIVVFTGPMFAGKSTKLMDCYLESSHPNKAVFKYARDTRYSKDAEIVTHNNQRIPCHMITKCYEINNHLNPEITEIYLDEAQFFTCDLFDWLNTLKSQNTHIKNIYLAGLNLDAKGNIFSTTFNDVTNILADECHLLYAICYICNDKATHTTLLTPKYNQQMEGNILIGGSDIYQPTCKTHFEANHTF
jgi:thymidine kinase